MANKFNFGNYNSETYADDQVYTEAKGYDDTNSEESTRRQFSFPLSEIKNFINNVLFDGGMTPKIRPANLPLATMTTQGAMSPTEKMNLSEYSTSKQDTLTAGDNITITGAVISASYPEATTSTAGLMSATDKTKLNNVPSIPIPTSGDSGKVPTVNSAGTAYELADMPDSDKWNGVELDKTERSSSLVVQGGLLIPSVTATTDTEAKYLRIPQIPMPTSADNGKVLAVDLLGNLVWMRVSGGGGDTE